mgnify:CR=1 FL=1
MSEMMRNGGYPMWIILVFGAGTLLSSALFAHKPDLHRLRAIGAMGLATLMAIFGGTASALAAVCMNVAHNESLHGTAMPLVILQGLGEALANPILGFNLLAMSAFVVAFGLRRIAH